MKITRITAGICALTMCCGNVLSAAQPLSVCADDLYSGIEPEIIYSGKCGDHITWHFDDETNTLTLEGSGAMYDYFSLFDLIGEDDDAGEILTYPEWSDRFSSLIEHVVVGEGIESIGDFAFFCAIGLQDVSLPDSLTRIGQYAFFNTENLQTVKLPKSIKILDDYAFCGNERLSGITLPDGLQTIGEHCFEDTKSLSKLDVPDSVSYIGPYGLTNNADWYKAHRTDDYLILGDGILYQYFGTEKNITIPDTVKRIAGSSFCKVKYETAYIDYENEVLIARFTPNEAIESIILPDSVTELQPNAFAKMKKLRSVTLPQHLEIIGNSAFQECTALTEICLPETVRSIGESAFYNCSALTEFNIPSGVTSIGINAFDRTKWLVQAGDTAILGQNILYCYQGKNHVCNIPDGVRSIASGAFRDDRTVSRIVEIQIPDTVTDIQPKAINCKDATVAGRKGSAAEAYAKDNSLPFRDIAPAPHGTDMTINYETDVWSFSNTGGVFGGDYCLSDAAREKLDTLDIDTGNIERDWSGSCAGLAITVILAKNGILLPGALQNGAASLPEIEPTEAVQSLINYYHCTLDKATGSVPYEPDACQFYRMLQIARNVRYGESPFLLTFKTENGAHAVAGYGLEEGTWTFDGKTYDSRVLVWDPNAPDSLRETSCLYYDSQTFDFCIPHFGVHYSEGANDNVGHIMTVTNDLSILNAYPYPGMTAVQTGDVDLDGSITAADAALFSKFLCAQTEMTPYQITLCDLSGDKRIAAADLTLLKRHLLVQ